MKLPMGKLPMGKIGGGKLPLGKLSKVAAGLGRSGAKETAEAPEKGARRKIPLNRATLAVGSGLTIFAIGVAMQNLGGHTAQEGAGKAADRTPIKTQSLAALPSGLDVGDVTPTSTGALPKDAAVPALPQDRVAAPTPDAMERTDMARLEDASTPMPLQTASTVDLSPLLASVIDGGGAAPDRGASTPVLPCEIALTTDPAPAAMVDLIVDASCLPNERFTLHHNGMMFHAVTDAEGNSSLRVPALAENAVFIASFNNSEGAVAQIEVPTMEFYDRVVVQWRGDAGLGLHALEFDATYFAKGHVHAGDPGDMGSAASGNAGFLTRFGHDVGPEALMAEIYTFPSRMSETGGRIGLSVEAEVTAANCGKEVEAQTLQLKPGETLRTNDLTLYMPACDANGDFLVLKNLLEDLKVAAN